MGICHPEKTNVYRGEAEVDIGFRVSDIDFYQMSLSQSESTILHESIIYCNVDQGRVCQNFI